MFSPQKSTFLANRTVKKTPTGNDRVGSMRNLVLNSLKIPLIRDTLKLSESNMSSISAKSFSVKSNISNKSNISDEMDESDLATVGIKFNVDSRLKH